MDGIQSQHVQCQEMNKERGKEEKVYCDGCREVEITRYNIGHAFL